MQRPLLFLALFGGFLLAVTYAQNVCLADIVFVIDHSGSIRDTNQPNEPDNWDQVIGFVKRLVQGLDIGVNKTHVGAVGYGNTATVFFGLTEYMTTDAVLRGIDLRFQYRGGNTNTTGGLRKARLEVLIEPYDRPLVPNIIILVTDGIATYEASFLPAEAKRIKDQGDRIIAVGVTDQVNEQYLKDRVVSLPVNDSYFAVTDFAGLNLIINKLVEQACRTLSPLPTPAPTTPAPGVCASQADIFFVLDASGSINEVNFKLVKEFTKEIVRDLPIDSDRVRFGLITFSNSVREQFKLNTYRTRSDVLAAVDRVVYTRGTTNTADALNYLRNTGFRGNGDRSNVPNIAAIITDGGSNNKKLTLDAAYDAKKAGIHLLSIGVGDWTDPYELRNLASYPSKINYHAVARFTELQRIKSTIRDLICDNVKECNSNPCRNGGTCIEAVGMYICLCQPGYAGRSCDKTCRENSDVVFALDASGSIQSDNFELQTDFVRELIFGMNINGNSGTRVGLETFANSPSIRFYMNDYSTKIDVLNALTLHYTRGTTNTAAALATMRNNMFTSGRGDRGNVPNRGILITDGRSNDFQNTWKEARDTRKAGISMLAIGVGNNIREKELEAIASWPTKQNILYAADFQALSQGSLIDDVLDAVCNNDLECQSNPCQNGGQCVDLMYGYRCDCRNNFSGTRCERRCSEQYDISFIIDTSGSIRRERMPYILNFVNDVIDEFTVGQNEARISSVSFSDSATMGFEFDDYYQKQDVMSAINQTAYKGGRTRTEAAIGMMMDDIMRGDRGDRNNVQNFVIVITDGGSNIQEAQTVPKAIQARIKGVHTKVIGIGDDLNRLELNGIASKPSDQCVFVAQSYKDLPQFVNILPQSMCDDTNECNSGPCRNGAQCIDQLFTYTCVCNGEWAGKNCDRRCQPQMDVVFVLDFSGSMEITYNIVMAFTEQVIYGLPMNFGRTRVGLIYFMDTAQNSWFLNTYQTRVELLNAMAFGATGGRTNTQEALRRAANDQFTSGRGDRNGVDNIAIIVTDGGSNIQRNNLPNEARNLRNRGVEVYVAAITDKPDMGEVNEIATDPDNSHVVRVRNQGEVNRAANQLLDRLCV